MAKLISEEERARRLTAISYALATVGLERLQPSAPTIAASLRWAQGEISMKELLATQTGGSPNLPTSEE